MVKLWQSNSYVGQVIIQDKNGTVDETIVLRGIPGSGLDEAAVQAIEAVLFEPAKQQDQPWISVPVNFELDNK